MIKITKKKNDKDKIFSTERELGISSINKEGLSIDNVLKATSDVVLIPAKAIKSVIKGELKQFSEEQQKGLTDGLDVVINPLKLIPSKNRESIETFSKIKKKSKKASKTVKRKK